MIQSATIRDEVTTELHRLKVLIELQKFLRKELNGDGAIAVPIYAEKLKSAINVCNDQLNACFEFLEREEAEVNYRNQQRPNG